MAEAKQTHDYDTALTVWFEIHKIVKSFEAMGGGEVELDSPLDHHPFRRPKPREEVDREAAKKEVEAIKAHIARLQLVARAKGVR